MNAQRTFDLLQKEKLGKYIYALRDPRDKKIFYVGQGINDRIFDHFFEAEQCSNLLKSFNEMSSKVIRILDIWKNNEDVQWLILSYNLAVNESVADYVESAVVDCLSESQNGETLNEVSPPKSLRLLPEDLEAMAAEFINPSKSYQHVFIFPIQNALAKGMTPYNATRTIWAVNADNRSCMPAYGVGLKNSISRGSFEISSWNHINNTSKYEFISAGHPNPINYEPFLNKNWNNVLAIAKGFWQRGNYLIVSFNGKGKFKIIRGSQDTNWHNCIN